MSIMNGTNAVGHARRVEQSLSNALGDAERLVASLAPGLAETVQERVRGPIEEAQRISGAMARLLESIEGGSTGRGGKSRKAAKPEGGAKRTAGRKKRGVRGVRADLTAAEITSALERSGGVKTKAAKALGVSTPTFNKYLAMTATPSKKARGASKGRGRARKKKQARAA